MRTLVEILQSTSSALFPAELGSRLITIETRDCDGDTALHVCVRRKDREAVRLLLDAGADPNGVGDMGLTPLHIAIQSGSADIAGTLLAHGARSDIRSEFGRTAFEVATEKGGEVARLVRRGGV